MSDVLLHNAFKDYFELNRRLIDHHGDGIDADYRYNMPGGLQCTCGAVGTDSTFYGTKGKIDLTGTRFTDSWQSIPQMCEPTDSFKVCDTSGYYRCGSSCVWVVPEGISKAQFQLWGPGGATSSQCCCGGAPFGATGAYASVIMDVSPGDTYDICAGCAYCCYAFQNGPGCGGAACGCPSYITGPGLNCLCADSGIACVCYWREAVGHSSCETCSFPIGSQCSPNSCLGWSFCWDSGDDAGFIYYSYSNMTRFHGTSDSGDVYGLPGMYPSLCIGKNLNNYYGWGSSFTKGAPVFGFLEQSMCTECFQNRTCAPCCRSFVHGTGKMPIPGAGGYGGAVAAGCNTCGGDSGRMGMVCVRMC